MSIKFPATRTFNEQSRIFPKRFAGRSFSRFITKWKQIRAKTIRTMQRSAICIIGMQISAGRVRAQMMAVSAAARVNGSSKLSRLPCVRLRFFLQCSNDKGKCWWARCTWATTRWNHTFLMAFNTANKLLTRVSISKCDCILHSECVAAPLCVNRSSNT